VLGERDRASPAVVTLALLPEIEAAIDEAASTIGALDADAWGRRCEAEGWPVAVVALHIALGLRRQASSIALARDGRAPFAFDWEVTHALNARVAARGIPTKEAVRRELHKGRTRLLGMLTEMSETALHRVALTYQGHDFDVERVMRGIVLPHARGHLASIRASVASTRRQPTQGN
jgi:mycothiol maleylpyruvate isomerase-like protein